MNAIITNVNVPKVAKFQPLLFSPYTIIGFSYIFWAVLTSHCADATTIFVCGNRDTLVITTDSKQTNITDHDTSFFPACKILKINDSLFAACTGDIAVSESWNITDSMNLFANIPWTGNAVNHIRFLSRRIFGFMTTKFMPDSTKPSLKIIYLSREGGKLRVHLATSAPGDSPYHYVLDEFAVADSFRIAFSGVKRDKIREILPPTSTPLILQAQLAMDALIAIDTVGSGPPVDMLCLYKTGYRWIQRKPECK